MTDTLALIEVDPTTVLVDRNIREADVDPDLVASIKAVGLLEPPTLVKTSTGDLLVRYGHRRLLASIKAGLKQIPALYKGDEGTIDNASEITRIVTQLDENSRRKGLTPAEEVNALEQLCAFGLKAEQIVETARIKEETVHTSLAIARSKLAKGVAQRHDDLSLEHLAAVAEFEDDPEIVKRLMASVPANRFDHELQRARDDRSFAQRTAEITELLANENTRIVDRPSYNAATQPLHYLKANEKAKEALTLEEHQACPGHVAWLDTTWTQVGPDGKEAVFPDEPENAEDQEAWASYEEAHEQVRISSRQIQFPSATYGCENPKAHGHVSRYGGSTSSPKPKAAEMSEKEREAAKAARRLVIENNKAWASAKPVRQAWVAKWASAKTQPKGSGKFLATALANDRDVLNAHGARALAGEWLGNKTNGRSVTIPSNATDARCAVIALVQVLAGYEANLTDNSWRDDGHKNACGRYLRFLKAIGYGLSEVEEFAISNKTA